MAGYAGITGSISSEWVAGFEPVYLLYVRNNGWCTSTGVSTWQQFLITDGLKDGIVAEKPALSERINVYPNPVNDLLNIVFTGDLQQGANFMIYNSTGALVESSPVSSNELQISTSKLANGMYILKVINGSEVISKSFFKN